MKVNRILYSSYFLRRLKKIPEAEKLLLEKFERIFRNDCFNPGLKTHKLSGKFENVWSCSLNYSTRILFKIKGQDVIFIDIGSHAVYNKK